MSGKHTEAVAKALARSENLILFCAGEGKEAKSEWFRIADIAITAYELSKQESKL